MVRRSLTAFGENAARACASEAYFWTFTAARAADYEQFRSAWNRLLRSIRKKLPDFAGVRVYEPHPGRWGEFSHGLHVHALTNKRFSVDRIRSIMASAKSFAWGRVHVVRVQGCISRMVGYLSKYLTKQARGRSAALKGWRLWSSFGLPDDEKVRVADIEADSFQRRIYRHLCGRDPAFSARPFCVRMRELAAARWHAIANDWVLTRDGSLVVDELADLRPGRRGLRHWQGVQPPPLPV